MAKDKNRKLEEKEEEKVIETKEEIKEESVTENVTSNVIKGQVREVESRYYSEVFGKVKNTYAIHIEGNDLIIALGTYGPLYNVNVNEDMLIRLLQERAFVTDPSTRKRYVLENGKPVLEK